MGIELLGPLSVDGRSNGLAPRDKVILAALSLHPGDTVTADRLADALWQDAPPATWSKVVQGSVVRLRKTLGASAIETVDHGYRLALDRYDVDLHEFERLLARGREQLSLGEVERASYTLGQALSLWRGRPLTELEAWEPGRAEAARLEEERRDAEELRLEAELGAGRHRDVLGEALRRVEEAPLRERRWELLTLAQYRCGRQAEALRTLRQVRRVLAEELGLDPGPDLAALEQSILRQDPSLLAPSTAPTTTEGCPYLGLVPYDVGDAEGYFGRDADVTECLHRLADTGVVAVVGPSGSGKSSLVRAGMAAALRRDGRRVTVVTPGARPMAALSAIPAVGPRPVLVVDQCEEAVAPGVDVEEQAAFFAALSAHARRAPLVIAFRADRLGDLAAHGDFVPLVERGLHLLRPMSADNLRAVIEGPARQAGLRLEAGLVELLVTEVEGQAGALPHLSHALRQTWERREGSVLTLDGYRATGGIRDAVALSAEKVYDAMSADQRTMLRDLMLRLVTPGPEGEPVRSRVPRRLLSGDAEHEQLLERLVEARLVTTGAGVVELAHESLARAWPRLRGWIDDDAEGQRILRHLSVAADTWDSMGRTEDELYRGTRLAQALDWRTHARPDLTPVEQAFLDAGRRLAEAEEQSAARRAQEQTAINRRLRARLAGLAFLLVVALVAGALAFGQADRAAQATGVADARRVAAQSQLTDRIDRSLQLAVAAHTEDPSAESRASLLAALARIPQLIGFTPAVEHRFWHLDISPDGRQLAVMDAGNHVRFYDTESLRPMGDHDPFPEDWDLSIGGSADPIAYSPTGDFLAMSVLNLRDEAVRLVDPRTFRPLPEQVGGIPVGSYPNDVDVSPDGRFLAMSLLMLAQRERYAVFVWDLRRPQRPLHDITLKGDTQYVDFTSDGSRLLVVPGWSSNVQPVVRVFDVTTGRQVDDLGRLGQPLEVSPQGATFAHAEGVDVVVARTATGAPVRRLTGPQQPVRQVRWSRDGLRLLAVSEDRTVSVWEVSSGRLLERLPLGSGLWADARFSHDATRVFAATDIGLMVFDLEGGERYVRRVVGPDHPAVPAGWVTRYPAPDGATVAVGTWDPQRRRTDLSFVHRGTGRVVPAAVPGWDGDNEALQDWTPQGDRLAFVDGAGRLRVAYASSGSLLTSGPDGASSVEYDDQGDRVLAIVGGAAVLLDAWTLEPVTEPVSLRGRRTEIVVLGPAGDTAVLLTTKELGGEYDWFGAARRWTLVDLETREVLRQGRLRYSAQSAALSPDGRRLAVGSADGLELVDLRTGATRRSADLGAAHETEGRHVTWSGDGALVTTSDGSGRVSLWDGRTSTLLGTIRPGATHSSSVFLEDDRTLLIAGWDGAVYEWDTSVDHAVDTACRIVGSGLDEARWRAAFGGRAHQQVC